MIPKQLQIVIDELQDVIIQTISLMYKFEDKEMQESLAADYKKLHRILTKATKTTTPTHAGADWESKSEDLGSALIKLKKPLIA